jgi:hypothetical protein
MYVYAYNFVRLLLIMLFTLHQSMHSLLSVGISQIFKEICLFLSGIFIKVAVGNIDVSIFCSNLYAD